MNSTVTESIKMRLHDVVVFCEQQGCSLKKIHMHGVDAAQNVAQNQDIAGEELFITGATLDSRRANAQTAFFAAVPVEANARDTHTYIEAALQKGAWLIVGDNLQLLQHYQQHSQQNTQESHPAARFFYTQDARRCIALLSHHLAGSPSKAMQVIGLTGTNGKTTGTFLLSHMMSNLGKPCAVVGTVGVGTPQKLRSTGYTTPQAETLATVMRELRDENFAAVAMEVSSHALTERRADGIHFAVTAFTNFTHDHLDFHGSMEAYFAAKARLFTDVAMMVPAVLPIRPRDMASEKLWRLRPDAVGWGISSWWNEVLALPPNTSAMQPTPSPHSYTPRCVVGEIRSATAAGLILDVKTYVYEEDAVSTDATANSPNPNAYNWCVIEEATVESALVGAFNAENILTALAVAVALGHTLAKASKAISDAPPPKGRLQRVEIPEKTAQHAMQNPTVVVDYAHTPDALERAIDVLRPLTTGALWVIFGCGGDRDPLKRPVMGKIAASKADVAIATDDNPRSESSSAILDAIEVGMRDAQRLKPRNHPLQMPHPTHQPSEHLGTGFYARIADRRAAIEIAITAAAPNDVILIAGKGHETGQIVGDVVHPFDDVQEAAAALQLRSS